ncbi:MAG: phosphocholine cytidylyltransferase family protein [Solobacterium sp.]|nr:phosphocholine cytidylyltransferase family protein [Solobacterium sp.]
MAQIVQAIILAAGKGERLRPLTADTPKPLLEINGIRPLDTILDALHRNGIRQICIVTGFHHECFADYAHIPGIHLLYNPHYDTANNIVSLYTAREFLGNTIILDGDQIIHDPSVLSPCFGHSGYTAARADGPTKEWLLEAENGRILSCSRSGGDKGWRLISISRWDEKDGAVLRECLEKEMEKGEHLDLFWDDIPLFLYPERFQLYITPVNAEAVKEVDTLQDLEDQR